MKLYNYKRFNESSDDYIHEKCKEYDIKDYTINADGSIDVDGNVIIRKKELEYLPLIFKRVSGLFYCAENNLTSLEGCPEYVGALFGCSKNKLTTLKGCPKIVMGSFYCSDNNIRDFHGFPEFYEGDIYFERNPVNVLLSPIKYQEYKFIQLLNEYDVIRNGRTIIRDRLEEAYYGIGLELPDDINIYGYEII